VDEVACVFRPLVEEVRARGIAPERLLRGIPIQLEELGNPRRRISWDDFTELARRCSELFGPDAFEELAARSAERALPAPLRWLLLGWWRDVRRAYRIAPFWGPRVFRATRAECELLPDGRLRQVIEILPPYRESPEFFRGVKGLLRATPRLFGEPDASVELVCDGRRGEFLIEPAARPARAALRTRLADWGREARWRAPADSAGRFARTLARSRGWREIPALAARSVQQELGVRGVALSLGRPPQHASDIVAAAGDRSGRPASVRPLVFAGRTVGSLVLWTPGGRALGEEVERRLHALRPQLAFLLETLHIDEANRRLMELLESNLSDWKRIEASLERIAAGEGEADPLLTSTVPPFEGTVLVIEDDELLRRRSLRDIEAQGHAVLGVSSDLAELPAADPASGPIRLVVADLEKAATLAESLHRIVSLHKDLRGVLLVRLRRR
jgi:hypothetical protein